MNDPDVVSLVVSQLFARSPCAYVTDTVEAAAGQEAANDAAAGGPERLSAARQLAALWYLVEADSVPELARCGPGMAPSPAGKTAAAHTPGSWA